MVYGPIKPRHGANVGEAEAGEENEEQARGAVGFPEIEGVKSDAKRNGTQGEWDRLLVELSGCCLKAPGNVMRTFYAVVKNKIESEGIQKGKQGGCDQVERKQKVCATPAQMEDQEGSEAGPAPFRVQHKGQFNPHFCQHGRRFGGMGTQQKSQQQRAPKQTDGAGLLLPCLVFRFTKMPRRIQQKQDQSRHGADPPAEAHDCREEQVLSDICGAYSRIWASGFEQMIDGAMGQAQ